MLSTAVRSGLAVMISVKQRAPPKVTGFHIKLAGRIVGLVILIQINVFRGETVATGRAMTVIRRVLLLRRLARVLCLGRWSRTKAGGKR